MTAGRVANSRECPDGLAAVYLTGGAYWMPPAFQSWFNPCGIFKFGRSA